MNRKKHCDYNQSTLCNITEKQRGHLNLGGRSQSSGFIIRCTKSFSVINLLYVSTCFEHYVLIIRRSKLYYTTSGIVTHVG